MEELNKLWWQYEWIERKEIGIADLPEYFKHDFEIWTIGNKPLDKMEGCKIYRIKIISNYDYEREDEEINKMESELDLKLKQEWIDRYDEETDTSYTKNRISKKHLQKLEKIRMKRQCDWWEENREVNLQGKIDNEKKEARKKIKESLKWEAYKDIEKFKEYPSIYNLLKKEISTKREFNDIDVIIIEDKKKDTWINVPVPKKIAEKILKNSIKSYIKNILHQPFWVDKQSYKDLVNNYTNEIYSIFITIDPTEKRAKIQDLEKKDPNIVAIRNSIEKKSDVLSYFSRPSSWGYKYDDMIKDMSKNNTIYEVKF